MARETWEEKMIGIRWWEPAGDEQPEEPTECSTEIDDVELPFI